MESFGTHSTGTLTIEGKEMCNAKVANMWILWDSWITRLQKFVGEQGVDHDMEIPSKWPCSEQSGGLHWHHVLLTLQCLTR